MPTGTETPTPTASSTPTPTPSSTPTPTASSTPTPTPTSTNLTSECYILQSAPFGGCTFVFKNQNGTTIETNIPSQDVGLCFIECVSEVISDNCGFVNLGTSCTDTQCDCNPPTSTPTPTPTRSLVPTFYTVELRLTGMEDRNGSFVLYQSPDNDTWTQSVTLTTIGNEVAIQSFNGTPGYYYYYVVTKTSGATCKVNVFNNVFDGVLGDFSPGPINNVVDCGDDTRTTAIFQLPDPKQTRNYVSFNGSLASGCI
jgi:hypothetical protein